MPYYRISFVVEGRRYYGIKESDMTLAQMYQDYKMKLNHRYGLGRIEGYDCVMLYEGSPEVKRFIENQPDNLA